jgi:hypothetical protein
MFIRCYKNIVSIGREMVVRLVAITIVLSFFAILAPIAGASWGKSAVMACCIGKEAGHCDSGLMADEPPLPPEPEPMCGSHSITIVAEPAAHSHNSRHTGESSAQAGAEFQVSGETEADAESKAGVESASLSRPCPMDCGACTTSTLRVQKRQKDIIQAKTFHSVPGAITPFKDLARVFSSNKSWTTINPRGPPATSV